MIHDCEWQIVVANFGSRGKKQQPQEADNLFCMLYLSDTKTSIAFSPILGGMPHEFVLPHNFLQPVAKDQDVLHLMEQFPKIVGHAVDNSDAVQWVLESETKETILGKVQIGQALNSLIQES